MKYKILESVYESEVLSDKDKLDIEKKLLRQDSSLKKDRLERLTLEACLPDKEKKAQLWDLFVYKNREDLLDFEYEAYMKGFARRSQYKLLKEYFKDKFFSDFIYVKNTQSEDYAVLFFEHLNPCFAVSKKVLEKYKALNKEIRKDEYKIRTVLDNSKTKM